MGGRGSASMTGGAGGGGLSSQAQALKDFLLEGAARQDKGKSAKSKMLAAEARATANLIGTGKGKALLDDQDFRKFRLMTSNNSITSSHMDEVLQGLQRPLGMNKGEFDTTREFLRNLKNKGYTNEEIAGAIRWGTYIRQSL